MRAMVDTPTRTAVLWVPDWPVVAAAHADGLASGVPAAVHDGRRLTAVSAAARAQGVRRGQRRRHAQGCCPELVLLPVDEDRDARAFETVAVAAEEVVAGLEVGRPGLLLMPAAGAGRYHGSEQTLLARLVETVVARTGHDEARAGVADGLLAAIVAAREGVVVPAGASAAYLAPRPLATLVQAATSAEHVSRLDDLADLLGRLGLRTLGDLAALAPGDVEARFGALGSWAHRLARGHDLRPPARRRPEADLVVAAELDPPLDRVDAATFVGRRLAEELHALLLVRSFACGRLQIAARTTSGADLVRVWRTDLGGLGGLTAARITDRIRWQLEGWLGADGRPGGARAAGTSIDGYDWAATSDAEPRERDALVRLELAAQEVSPAGAEQGRLWGQASGADRRAHRALDRTQGVLGADRVLQVELQGGRGVRDQVRLTPWGQATSPGRPLDRPWPGRLPEPAPATVLEHPEPVEVLDAAGQPVRVDVRLRTSAPPALVRSVAAAGRPRQDEVVGWAGPWPVAERWWTATPGRRIHLQVALAGGDALLLACAQGRWTCEARYD